MRGNPEADYAADRILVRFRSNAAVESLLQSQMQKTISPAENNSPLESVRSVDRIGKQPMEVYKITDGTSVLENVKKLRQMPDVEFAEPDFKVSLYGSWAPSDPDFALQWHHEKIGSLNAWQMTTGSTLVKVCVIDSGVRTDHPDLSANVVKGWNVIPRAVSDPYPQPGQLSWNDFNDTLGHGTHVAGLVGSLGDNGRGGAGVAWKVGLLPCRFIADSGEGYVSDAITCMRLCAEEGAHVYTNSWGGVGFSQFLADEIAALDGVFVVAAGNDGGVDLDDSPIYPASFDLPNLIAVASTTKKDQLSGFSNFGLRSVHVGAPGSDIISTVLDGGIGVMSGTSMATPIVSGAACLLQSLRLDAGLEPLSGARIKEIILSTVDHLETLSTKVASGGRLNVEQAVQAIRHDIPPMASPPLPSSFSASTLPSAPRVQGPEFDFTTHVNISNPPQCGTSPSRGKNATQSTTLTGRQATFAVNGDCRTFPSLYPTACASTSPASSNPWWTVDLATSLDVAGVSIMTRADCCWDTIGGAIILLGNSPWLGLRSYGNFVECGQITLEELPRGSRHIVSCSAITNARFLAIHLPKIKTSLTLCEVDVILANSTSVPPM